MLASTCLGTDLLHHTAQHAPVHCPLLWQELWVAVVLIATALLHVCESLVSWMERLEPTGMTRGGSGGS